MMTKTNHPKASLGLIVFSLLVLGERSAHAAAEQEGIIRGRIIEAETGAPVPGATVAVSSPSLGEPRSVTSNEEGEYVVPNLPIGVYTVKVAYAGVKPVTREILVQPGRAANRLMYS